MLLPTDVARYDQMTTAKIIRGNFGSPRIVRDENDGSAVRSCRHFSKKISMEKRSVYCGLCNTELDPISVLAEVAERDAEMVQLQHEKLKLIEEIRSLSKKKRVLSTREKE